jgi:hypothetical protein
MEQKCFTLKSRNCFREAKKAPLLLYCSKKRFEAKQSGSRRRPHRTSEQIFYTNVASEQFFLGEVILPETSPETSEQIFCTNVASEQFFSGKVILS